MRPAHVGRQVDANQGEVVDALRAVGAAVWIIGKPLDLLVGFRRVWRILEVKDGAKVPSARKLTPAEAEFIGVAESMQLPVAVVNSPREALVAIGAVSP